MDGLFIIINLQRCVHNLTYMLSLLYRIINRARLVCLQRGDTTTDMTAQHEEIARLFNDLHG